MITIQTQSDGVLFNFQDSTRYLYGDGSILTPYNSLTLIADESNVLTFRKSASNDIFITAGYDELGYSSKEEAINDLKTKLFKATGGSESGITSGDVDTMIDNSLEDYYDKDDIDAEIANLENQIGAKADGTELMSVENDVIALQNAIGGKADTSAVTAVNNALTAHTADTGIHVSQLEKDGWNAKLDASAYTPTDLSEYWTSAQTEVAISAATSGKADTTAVTAVNNALTAHTSDTGIHVTSQEKDTWNSKVDVNQLNEAVSGKADTSAVTAVENEITVLGNALAGKANTAALTAHTSDTGIHVSTQEKNAWNAKAEPYSAGTGIEISGNVISATGGGGATYSAGYGINIDTANTISFNMPITCTTNTNDNITIGNGTNNGYWSLLVGNDMSITNSTGSIGLCVSDMSIGGSSISGNTRGVLIGCQNTIKGGDISVGGGVAIGDRNQSTDGGIVIGTNSKASGSSTVAIGLSANATGTTKMNLNNQIKVDTNNQIYIKDKTNTTEICLQDALSGGGGGSVTVDSELDMNSSNPVENQAIAAPIEDIYNALDGSYNDGTQMVKLKRISKSDYDDLVNMGTIDYDTLYIITPDEPAEENEGGE